MNTSYHWARLKPAKRCQCGELATRSLYTSVDSVSLGTEYFCDPCAGKIKFEIPKAKRGRKLHREFGMVNVDSRSNVNQSIPNWGNKIKSAQRGY